MTLLPKDPWCIITFYTADNKTLTTPFSNPLTLSELAAQIKREFGENYRCYTNQQGTLKRLRKDSDLQKLIAANSRNVEIYVKISRTLSKSESPRNISLPKFEPLPKPFTSPSCPFLEKKKRGHRRTKSDHASYSHHRSYVTEPLTPDYDRLLSDVFPSSNEGGRFVPDIESDRLSLDLSFQNPDNPYNSSSTSTITYDLPLHLQETFEIPPGGTSTVDPILNNNMDTVQKSDIADKYVIDSEFLAPEKYTVNDMIGSGGFSKVYHCIHHDTGREMAMKTVPICQEGDVSSKEIKALKNEIEILKKLQHQYIVQYIGCNMVERNLNIFMEYVGGGSMRRYINKNGALSNRFTVQCLRYMLSGLQYLHHNRIGHRDLKAANVLKTTSGQVKLADFGASKRIKTITSINSVIGTPYWMAPEVIKENGTYSLYKVDVWGIGVTAIEFLTEAPPYFNAEPMSAMFKIASKPLRPYVTLPDSVTEDLRDFIYSCVEYMAENRPPVSDLLKHAIFDSFV